MHHRQLRRALHRLVSAAFVASIGSIAWMGCVLPFGNDSSGGSSPTPPSYECTTDAQCASTPSCRRWQCVDHKCQSSDLADGVESPSYVGNEPACKKVVCDGKGGTRTTPDPTNTPPDTPGDCKKESCDASGSITKVNDDTDPPAPTTCLSYTCSGGSAVGSPIHPTTKCSPEGFVCGPKGACDVCPVPDATCSDTGPGSRVEASAHDFAGIGRTDSGGRWFCGAVPSGAAEYYTYYDDGTGFLASFDPYFEVEPQAPTQMCVFFSCPSIACPTGTTSSSSSGHPGCCLDAPAGVFTGAAIPFCDGGRVTIRVTTTSACSGYELHFHD